MLKIIIKKELLENLVSYKFILITIACFMLLGFSNYAMYKNYQKNLEDYNLSSMQAGNVLIRKPPSVLSIYVNGVQDLLERTFWYQQGMFEPMDINFLNFNVYRQLFPVLDFAYLVKIVLSFLAMILGFDLLCGEKVRGTLRLMLGNSVSRNTIILGKILGNYLAFVIPLLVAFLSYFIVLQIMPDVSFSVADHLRLLLICGVSMLYLFIFLLIALTISSLVYSPKSSIIECFLVWIFMVFLLPNILTLAARKFERIPDTQKIAEAKKWAHEEFKKSEQQHSEGWVRQQTQEKYRAISMDFRSKLLTYTRIAKLLNRFSPAGAYLLFTTNLTKYGLDDEHVFRQALFQHVQNSEANPGTTVPFKFKEMSLIQSMRNSAFDLFALLFFAVLLYLCAFVAFLKYDVR